MWHSKNHPTRNRFADFRSLLREYFRVRQDHAQVVAIDEAPERQLLLLLLFVERALGGVFDHHEGVPSCRSYNVQQIGNLDDFRDGLQRTKHNEARSLPLLRFVKPFRVKSNFCALLQ